MKNSSDQKTDELFKEVGEFGKYQLLVFVLVGITAFIPAFVGYSYSFYAAVPNHRCQLPLFANDSYEIFNDQHDLLVQKHIPKPSEQSYKDKYEKCKIRVYNLNEYEFYYPSSSSPTSSAFTTINVSKNVSGYSSYDIDELTQAFSRNESVLIKCNKWVYSQEYFKSTINTEWDLVCDRSPKRSLFSTLYFIGTYGVLLSGILSDRIGRKKSAFMFIIANAVLNIVLTFLISAKNVDADLQQLFFGIVRLFCGIASNVYAVAVVIAIEICGPSKRVMAANIIYYFYILGEFLVVFFAYFVTDFRVYYAILTGIMTLIACYFWFLPESPRWLLANKHIAQAYLIFKRIANSNNKDFDNLTELECLKKESANNRVGHRINPLDTANMEPLKEGKKTNTVSALQTLKLFFTTKKLVIRSLVIMLNWLTNTLVYYGISFNTTELAGNPYLNFFISVLVELVAILVSHYAFEKFGRKWPYFVNMFISGFALLFVLLVPKDRPEFITILALIGKFNISLTYNGVYIITAESYPTNIRNSAVSLCQTFARIGAVLAPNIQLLGELYWYPIPFVVYGAFSALSAITFAVFIPETKNKKLPDTIEEFMNSN